MRDPRSWWWTLALLEVIGSSRFSGRSRGGAAVLPLGTPAESAAFELGRKYCAHNLPGLRRLATD